MKKLLLIGSFLVMAIGASAQSISLPDIKGLSSIATENHDLSIGDGKSQGISSRKVQSLKDITEIETKGSSYRFSFDIEGSHYSNKDVVANGAYVSASVSQSVNALKKFIGLGISYGTFRSSTRLKDSSIYRSNTIEKAIYFVFTSCKNNDGWANFVWIIGGKQIATTGSNKSFSTSQKSNLIYSAVWTDLSRNRTFYPKWTWLLYGQIALDNKPASALNGKSIDSEVWDNTTFHTETQFKLMSFGLEPLLGKQSAFNIEPGGSFTWQKEGSLVTWGTSLTGSLYIAGAKLISTTAGYQFTPKDKGPWNSIPKVSVYLNGAHLLSIIFSNL